MEKCPEKGSFVWVWWVLAEDVQRLIKLEVVDYVDLYRNGPCCRLRVIEGAEGTKIPREIILQPYHLCESPKECLTRALKGVNKDIKEDKQRLESIRARIKARKNERANIQRLYEKYNHGGEDGN